MNHRLDNQLESILSLESFNGAINAIRADDEALATKIENELLEAVKGAHNRIHLAGKNRQELTIALYMEQEAILQWVSRYQRIADKINDRTGRLRKFAIGATDIYFNSLEKGLIEFFSQQEEIAIAELKKRYTPTKELIEPLKVIWEKVGGSEIGKQRAFLVGEVLNDVLSKEKLESALAEIFSKARKKYVDAWESVIKEQSLELSDAVSQINLDIGQDDQDAISSPDSTTAKMLSTGIFGAVGATVAVAAGWHTLAYAMANVFPPAAIISAVAVYVYAIVNEDENRDKKEEQIRKYIKSYHRNILLGLDIEPHSSLGGKTIRQAMQQKSSDLVNQIMQKWVEVVLEGLSFEHLSELTKAADKHRQLVRQCIKEADPYEIHRTYRKKQFTPDCDISSFSEREQEIIRDFGSWMSALASGEIAPYTEAQQHFCRVAKGIAEPESEMEEAWVKYVEYCSSTPAPPAKEHDIPEDELPVFGSGRKPSGQNDRNDKKNTTTSSKAASNAGWERSTKNCLDCGDPIPVERLKASPNAIRCIRCQQELESSNPSVTSRKINEPTGSREDYKKLWESGN